MSDEITIKFTPSKKQFQAWELLTDNKTMFIGYGGAAFGGKSYLLCYWLTIMCVSYPDTGWGLGRRELSTLKKTTLITLFKVFAECGITEKHYSYNGQLNVITFYNGSQIFLIDTAYKPSDPLYTRFGGYELTGAGIDESAETPYKAIDVLFTRTNRRNNAKYKLSRKIFETFNPAKNHVYTRYYKPYTNDNLKESHAFIPALPKDNPSPEVEDYINGILENADSVTIERLIYGNFEYDDDPSKLIDYNAITDIFSNTQVEKGVNYITADVARLGSDKAVIMVWSGWQVLEVVEFNKSRINEIQERIEHLKITYKVPHSRILADEDGVGGGLIDYMNIRGFVNGSKALNDENYSNLKSQCYYKLADKINKGLLYIANCNREQKDLIIQELEQVKSYKVDSDSKLRVLPKDKIKELIGRSPDYSDTLMMRCFFELMPIKKIYHKTY